MPELSEADKGYSGQSLSTAEDPSFAALPVGIFSRPQHVFSMGSAKVLSCPRDLMGRL
jgi:hypothetical protein